MKTNALTIPALLTVAIIGLSGCGSSSDSAADSGSTTQTQSTEATTTTPTTSTPASSTPTSASGDDMSGMVMIDILDFMYKGGMSVKAGQMVMVTNDDSEAHTLTSEESGMFAVTVAPGKTATFAAPTKPGTYAYHCDFHSNMHGSLVVS